MHDTTETIGVREGAAVWRDMDGEAVLLALDASRYLQLNRSATQLWTMVVEGTSRAAMVDRLVEEYGITEAAAAAAVEAFLTACRTRGLLAGQ